MPQTLESLGGRNAFATIALILGSLDGGFRFGVEFFDRIPFQRLQGDSNEIVGGGVFALS
jgi:hypothetical protein